MTRTPQAGATPDRHGLAFFAIGLVVAVVVATIGVQRDGPLGRIDRLVLDRFVERTQAEAPAAHAVVVDIDDISLSAVGQWPWPRYRLAALIERVAAQKPAAIGLDVLLPERDRASLDTIQETFKRDFGVDLAFSGVPGGLLDNDGYLGATMAAADVVGATYFYFDHASAPLPPSQRPFAFAGQGDLPNLKAATGVLTNADAIASQTRLTGFVNQQTDADGLLRRLPLLIAHDGVAYPSLALATTMKALGVTTGAIESDRDGALLRVGDHRIPIDEAGYATLRFDGGPSRYPSVSALDVLNGRVSPETFAGRIVFIGSSAIGLNDTHVTALDARFPGLKIQAVLVENILSDRHVRTPSWSGAAIVVVSLAAGLAVAALFVCASGLASSALGSVLLAAAVVVADVVAFGGGRFVSPAAPLLTIAALFVVFCATRYAIERRRSSAWQRQLENARQVTIESMASVAETRDPETGAHIKRTQHYVRAIAEQLQKTGAHSRTLTKQYIDLLFLSAPLHDIGKVGVPDHILLKPGRLTPEEFEQMRLHADFGRKIIFSTSQRIEGDNFLEVAGEIAATHHEKWDGTGYPLGLAGDAIPLAGRIMAVADIYDALISRRCYKEPFPHAQATALMRDARGTTFDPDVLDAFFAIEATIVAIAARFSDEGEASDGQHVSVMTAPEGTRAPWVADPAT